ncbi:hypothetical protein MRX96_007294 [Rhipicephalus microplus]
MASHTPDLEALVGEVEKHPLLYDPAHRDQRDAFKRSQAWKEIGKALNATTSTCKRQWRSVRDRFVREERLCRTSHQPVSEAERFEKWGLYRHLGFLAKVYKTRLCEKSALGHGTATEKNFVHGGRLGPSQSTPSPVQPVQAVQLFPSPAGNKDAEAADYDTGSECVILHPDVITQSVLLSMVSVPSPEEIIVPDQPPSMDVHVPTTNCGATSGHEQTSESAQREPAATAVNHVTIKEEPLSCRDRRRHAASGSCSRRPRRPSSGHDATSKQTGAGGDEAVDSADALLRHLAQATERVRVAADATTTCRLMQLDSADSDIMFLLSLRERLRSFGPRERSLALVRIQEVLHEIEFGTAAR